MTTSSNLLSTAAATLGADLKAFRSASVTGENKGNIAAKSLLAALVSGVMTEVTATAAILHAFGNPKSPKGKALDKLTASGDRLPGFGAVRKMAADCFRIFTNIDADSVIVGEGEGAIGGAIRPLVVAFILGEDNAPKSLRALVQAVNDAIRAYTKATQPANDGEDEGEGEGEGDAAPAGQSLTDRALALMVAFEAATVEEKAAAFEAFSALIEMLDSEPSYQSSEEAPAAIAA